MKIIDLERTLHVFVEPSIQAWALDKHWLMDLADWTYLYAHYVVTLAVLIFIYLRRNDSFYFVRNMFIVSMAIALVGYALYPDRAAAADARVGLHRRDLPVPRRPPRRRRPDEGVPQLLRGRPLDARVLRDDRAARCTT